VNITLLEHLRAALGEFVPISTLAWAVGATEEQAQDELRELERFGFRFEHHPYRGVAYRGPATRLCPDQIEHELHTRWVGRRVAVWNRVASTNDLANRASGSLANEGLVVLAEEQTAGRGRRGRQWFAPPGTSLLMSVLLFPRGKLGDVAWLTALGAVAVAEVVAERTGLETRIKWPNDVRVSGRKIAGILVERGEGAVIGIGLNVNGAEAELPAELRDLAASLRILTGESFDRSELARGLIQRLDHWYHRGLEEGPDSLSPSWSAHSEHLGRWVQVDTPAGPREGRLTELNLTQGLTLATGRNEKERLRLATHAVLSLVHLPEPTEARQFVEESFPFEDSPSQGG